MSIIREPETSLRRRIHKAFLRYYSNEKIEGRDKPCRISYGQGYRDAIRFECKLLQAQLAKHRWLRTDDPPDITDWDEVVEALEYYAEIPSFMTMAEIFLDEDSDVEYWRPIILPEGE